MSNLQRAMGYRVRSLRKACGLSQEQLGERAKLHNTYIGAIERGERNPSLKSIEKIAQALNLKVGDLLKFIDNEKTPREENMKAEIFALLEGREAKTIHLILNLINCVLDGMDGMDQSTK